MRKRYWRLYSRKFTFRDWKDKKSGTAKMKK